MSKVKGLPTGWLLEGISIGATHLLFKSWIQEGLRAHLAAGGKIASHLRALGAAIFGAAGITALLFAGFMGALLFGPTSLYDSFAHCVTFSRTYTVAREEVCYRHGASEAEARAVGTNGRRRAMVARLERSADKLVLSLQLDEEMLSAEDARRYFDDLARSVAAAVTPGKPFELRLCDEDWNVRATLPDRRRDSARPALQGVRGKSAVARGVPRFPSAATRTAASDTAYTKVLPVWSVAITLRRTQGRYHQVQSPLPSWR